MKLLAHSSRAARFYLINKLLLQMIILKAFS